VTTRRVKPYDRVRIVSSRHECEGAPLGTLGYVVEEYDDGNLEVEVSDATGATVAQFVARQEDVELAQE
jgi:hypothetical protein